VVVHKYATASRIPQPKRGRRHLGDREWRTMGIANRKYAIMLLPIMLKTEFRAAKPPRTP
jgi:hypothetical protein